jgi:hypothetical protein
MASKLVLKPEDYDTIDQKVALTGDEFYAVVTTRFRGQLVRSIHVFARQPMPSELVKYENTASRIKVRGSRTDVEGTQIGASYELYKSLIARAYDVPVGTKIVAQMDARTAIERVREALRDALGEHFSEGRIAADEDTEEVAKSEDDKGEGKVKPFRTAEGN